MRENILEKTFLLMVEKGNDDVPVSEIQRELGISRGLLYFYFKNKDDLVFEACRRYFFDGYLGDIDIENITLRDFLLHVYKVEIELLTCCQKPIDILKYNTLYSVVIMREPRFKKYALGEFEKALKVINNAIKRGEIKKLPANFVGATILSILGRTTYITKTASSEHVRARIIEDITLFYQLIKA